MTSRSDQKRLGGSLGVLGTLLEHRGEEAWDKFASWELGPSKAPAAASDDVCRCGHTPESHVDRVGICTWPGEERPCMCDGFETEPQGAGAEDRKGEAKQSARAAQHLAEHRADCDLLDTLVQRMTRRIDVACPPQLGELKNRRGDIDPTTAADIAVAGYCRSCWRNDKAMVLIDKDKRGLKYYRDYCRWCGQFKGEHGIEPPMVLLELRHASPPRSVTPEDIAAALKAEKRPKPKKKRKGKKAA